MGLTIIRAFYSMEELPRFHSSEEDKDTWSWTKPPVLFVHASSTSEKSNSTIDSSKQNKK